MMAFGAPATSEDCLRDDSCQGRLTVSSGCGRMPGTTSRPIRDMQLSRNRTAFGQAGGLKQGYKLVKIRPARSSKVSS